MNIEEMTMADITERMAAIRTEMENADADLDALEREVDQLEARKKELEKEEGRKAELRSKVAAGSVGTVVRGFVESEVGVMPEQRIEVRNSLEYGRAFLAGDEKTCRALLSTNVSGGSVAVPQQLEQEIKNAWEECQFLSLAKHSRFKGNVKIGFEYSATGAAVHVEGTAAPEEETLVWGYVELKAENIKKWITVSDEAIENTTLDTLAEIYKEVAQRIVEEAEEIAIGKIVAAPAASTATAAGVPVFNAATLAVDTVTLAVAELSGKAKNLTLVMNRRTEAALKSAAKNAKYNVDPFDGIKVIHTDALPAYSAAGSGDTYIIVGDVYYGFQANMPNGDEVKLKVDDMSLAEKDLVKIVGRQFVGMGVVAPKAFVKITK